MPTIYAGPVVGSHHAKPDFSVLAPGQPVRLVAEPENPYDTQAIRVESNVGQKLGYIPRVSTHLIHVHGVFYPDARLTATIFSLDTTSKWEPIKIIATLSDAPTPVTAD